jgi:molybdopterin-guanine dinucleotide biosynthesis protein A
LSDTEGVILAGGASRRMGRDKLLLSLNRRPVLERLMAAIEPLTDRVRLIGRDVVPAWPGWNEGRLTARADIFPGLGPLAGIHTALATAESPVILVVACDLPFVTTAFLRGLLERLTPEADAVVPSPASGPIPVCAVYRTSALAEAESRLRRRELAARDFVDALRARFVSGEELERLDPDGRCLLNLNTPADFETALRIAEG